MADYPPLPTTARTRPAPVFADPAIDTLLAMLLELAQQHWVTRDRLARLEHWVTTRPDTPWSEDYRLPPDRAAALSAERDAALARLLAAIDTL
ncbi:hypothetical protein [Sandaracinobacteroides saxicola]|uniref:Uncharacterized protein n=1 Tax=Sandaracinobacteroides saxicola TaxID=2759707 RepID=A0A7G5IIF7_9SPHN|nr:hypothetical protein [Sandaracinobacteroides saxicola]QMW23149.1 hypothetical protein H3309_01155 [Sandaracinobacteroides saxicola]